MEPEYQHHVLIATNDENAGKIMTRILQSEKVNHTLVKSGESAIEEIKKAKTAFSVIISDQSLPRMKGIQFLESAKKLTSNSSRFLMTSSLDMDTIINAVNKGSIQKFIAKPLNTEEVSKAIRSGLKQYELFLSNEKLLALAKKQNSKLYELSCELMETTKSQIKTIHSLDHDIETLEKEIENLSSQKLNDPAALLVEMETCIKDDQSIDTEKAEALLFHVILELYDRFNELAHQSGFEMPETEGDAT